MRKQIAISSLWMFGGNGLQQALQFVIFILLARTLQPAVFGNVAMATVVFDIVAVLARFGIPEALLQRRSPSGIFISHAFILSMVLGGALTLVVLLGTTVFTVINGWNILAQLLFMLAPITLLQCAEMVPEAILKQELLFKWIALRNNIASLLGGLVALGLALMHQGVYALVAQKFVSVAVLTGMVWLLAGRRIRFFPRRRYRLRMFLGITKVGSHLVSTPLAGMIGPRLTDMMVGVSFGPVALGELKIARRVFDFVAQVTIAPLSSVAEAAFPRLVGQGDELRKVYKKIQGVCALGVLPLFAGLAVAAPMWVPLVLGDKWNEAVPLIQWTNLAAIPAVVNYFQTPLLIAYRQNWLVSKQNMVRLVSGIALTIIGAFIGLKAVVILFVVQGYAFMIFNWFMIRRIANWSLWDNVVNIAPALIGTLGLLAAMAAFDFAIVPKTNWANFALLCGVGGVGYLAVLVIGMRQHSLGLLNDAIRLFTRSSI